MRYAYTGNVHDADGRQHVLPGCGALLIERDWYGLDRYDLTDDGRCRVCGTRLPGRFDGPAGRWGARRLPVRIGRTSMTTPTRVREPAVAGLFYPRHSRALAREVDALLADARPRPTSRKFPIRRRPRR